MLGWLFFLIIFLIIGGFFTFHILTKKKAIKQGKTTWLMKMEKKESVQAVSSSLLSIILPPTARGCPFRPCQSYRRVRDCAQDV